MMRSRTSLAMELTANEIDERNTRAAIDAHVSRTLSRVDWDKIERDALKQHPPVFRKTEPVSEVVRNVQVEAIKRRTVKTRKHVLP